MRRLYLCLLLYLAPLSLRAQACLLMDSTFRHSLLKGCLQTVTDSGGNTPVELIRSAPFAPIASAEPNFGTDGLTHWLTFTCQNSTNQAKQFAIEVDIVYADEMSFYVLSGQKIIRRIEHDSWQVPIWKRTYPSRYFVFPLDLAPQQAVQVYIRAREQSGTLVMPVSLWEKSAYERYSSAETLLFFLPAAILLLLTLSSLALYLFFPNSIWLFYSGHALGTALYILNIEGFLAHYAPPPFNQITLYALGLSLGWLSCLLFTNEYVYKQLRQPSPVLTALTYAVAACHACWIGYLLLTPFQGVMANVSHLLTGLTAGFLLVCLVVCLVRGSPEARFYLLAASPFLLFAVVRILNSLNLLPIQNWYYYARYYTPLFEIMVLGVGTVRQLSQERKHTMEQLAIAQQEIISAQETERQRLAADLHDDIGTSLAALRGQLNDDESGQLLDKIIDDVRAVSHNLMPVELHDLGLADALEEVARRFDGRSGVHFLFIQSGQSVALTPTAELVIYRIVQELMHNIVRHSGATQAVVQLVYHQKNLNITVEDNGLGVKKQHSMAGIGLKNVYSRIQWLGGQIAIDTGAQGTTIRLDIPYPAQTDGISDNTRFNR